MCWDAFYDVGWGRVVLKAAAEWEQPGGEESASAGRGAGNVQQWGRGTLLDLLAYASLYFKSCCCFYGVERWLPGYG